MHNTAELLREAVDLHRSGQGERAGAVYTRILEIDPSHADALHLLGLVSSDQGHNLEAAALIEQALALSPGQPTYMANLAMVVSRQGRHDDAIALYRRALDIHPGHAATLARLGRALLAAGRPGDAVEPLAESATRDPLNADTWNALGRARAESADWAGARESLARAIKIDPGFDEARENLLRVLPEAARLLTEAGDWASAAELYAEAVRLDRSKETTPASIDSRFNLALSLSATRRLEEARAQYEEVLRLRPEHPQAHNNLSNIFTGLGMPGLAEQHLRKAIAVDPSYWEAHYNLGVALTEMDRPLEAAECYRRVLALKPGHADSLNNVGGAMLSLNRIPEAIAAYDEAIAAQPGHPDATWNQALARLAVGDWERGLEGYESRLRQKGFRARSFAMPRWNGGEIAGRSILVWAEQGLGDAIQFLRFVPMLAARGARIVLECHERLMPLFSRAPGIGDLVRRDDPLPATDFEIPAMSLARAFGARPSTIPPPSPGFHVAARELGPGLKIGVCWAGNPHNHNGRRRSMPPELIAALCRAAPHANWFSLQYGATPPDPRIRPLVDGDIADTAALILGLDLVITVDTMIAHLGGALGVSTWNLLMFAPDWRWGLEGDSTPWYPSMRLWRQSTPGDWAEVIERVGAAIPWRQ